MRRRTTSSFDGERPAIGAFEAGRSLNRTLREREVKVVLKHDQAPVATLSLGLDGDLAQLVRARVCVS